MNSAQLLVICIPSGVAVWGAWAGLHRHHRLHPVHPSSTAALAALGRVNAQFGHNLHR